MCGTSVKSVSISELETTTIALAHHSSRRCASAHCHTHRGMGVRHHFRRSSDYARYARAAVARCSSGIARCARVGCASASSAN